MVSPGTSPPPITEREYPPAHSKIPLTKDILERIVGFQVSSFPGRYVEAFTHKSASRETRTPSLERLEFLGDSVISFVVAKYLFDAHPNEDEGFLTRLRTRLTCSATLASFARILGLQDYIVMNGISMVSRWNTNDRTLEDAFEALVGAIYMDRGLCVAKNFFLGLVEKYVDKKDLLENSNFKDILLRWARAQGEPIPVFESNKIHNQQGVLIHDTVVKLKGVVGRGADVSKKKAEMKAAKMALLLLKVPLST